MTQYGDKSGASSRHDVEVFELNRAPTGPLWFVVGLLAFAVAAIGFLVIEFGEPGDQRLAGNITIERQPEARDGGINIEGSIEAPRDTGGEAGE